MKQTKTYTNDDKISAEIKYLWSSKIDRKTENNNALVKCPPIFLKQLQEQKADLTSDRAIKLFICEVLKIEWKEEFMHFGDEPYQEPKQKATVKTDKSKIDWLTVDTALIKSKMTKADREQKLREAGISDDDLRVLKYIEAEPTTDDLIKEMLSGV